MFVVAFVVLFAIFRLSISWRAQPKHAVTLQLIDQTRDIINFSYAGASRENLEHRLMLRAQENSRLLRAFGIQNSFTMADVPIYREFGRASTKPLHVTNETWRRLYQKAEYVLGRDTQRDSSRLLLAPLARHLCLRIILGTLFNIDPVSVPKQDVSAITEEINRQWIRSKCDVNISKSSRLCSTLMSLRLKSMYREGETASPEEALAFILPAYETLWRVVLLTFVSAYHRPSDPKIIEMVKPIPACLGRSGLEDEALKLAKEGFRLYPSTKRIYRVAAAGSSTRVSANVELCHRHPEIWGADALEFRPDRFDNLSDSQKAAYTPFGLSPHQCPAYRGFGYRMVTLLVVALGRHLPAGKVAIRFDNEELDKSSLTPLPTGRDDMEGWMVIPTE